MAIEKRRMQQRYGTYEQFQSDLQNILDHEFISVDSGDTTLEGTTKGLYFKFPGSNPVRIYTTNEIENYNNKFNYYSVASGGDLDTIKDTGFYNFAGVDGYSNIPGGQTSKIKGTLLVVNHKFTTSTDVWNIDQYWFSSTSEVFARTYNYNEQFSSGSWSSWILIATDINNIVEDINIKLNKKENISNKTSNIQFPSIDSYPNTKAVWDYVESKLETPLADIESLKADKLDKADFNSYKTSNDNAVNSKVDTTDFNTYKSATDKAVADNTKSIKVLDSSKADLVQSRNLFDIKEYLKLLSTQQGPVTAGSLDSFDNDTFTITATKDDCYTNRWSSIERSIYKIEVEADTDYVLSWDCSGATGNVFVFYNAQAKVGNMVQVTNTKKHLAFRTNSDTEYITVRFGVALANNTTTYCRIQLEKGNSKSYYAPHQVAVGVQELDERVTKVKQEGTNANDNLAKSMLNLAIKNTTNISRSTVITDSSDNIIDLVTSVEEYHMCIFGKNLIDFKSFTSTGHRNAYVIADTYKIDKSNAKIEYDMAVGNYCGLYYKYKEFVNNSLLIDKDVTLSCVVETNKKCKFRLLDESTNKYVVKDIEADEPTRFSLGIKLNASDKAITFYAVNVEETTHIVISEIMFELNSVCTEYEEYKSVQEVSNDTDLSTIKTNYPTTTVLCDCDCQITYVTDTKNYIDNKFNELATALVAHESEVN